ncbi:uncharacterized protein LOC126783012 [Argentina anserina]|uniref:uncharacterized protein LOC126783012 n=1 Tax=Argentina anserina TaxID=57926 RepID=UPI00217662C4|nr:uncharacterized protein LOC126783012 [Potentilla anserina]
MATNSREARRRKILERGSDRLALITGQIQTLPSSSSSSSDPQTQLEHTTNPSSPPPVSDVQDQITESPSEIEEKENESDSTLPRSQSDTNTETLRAIDSQVQQLISSLTAQSAPPPQLIRPQRQPLFTASGLCNAIAETETTRLLISAAVAIMVVLVHVGFPLLGSSNILKSLLGFRPLYLVLLTNVTFVLARILFKQRVFGLPGEIGSSFEGGDWFALLGKALEIGMVVQKVLDALFMDCAVYAIIVVCGLSSSA